MRHALVFLALLPSLAFGQVLRRDGSTGTFSVPATGPSFTATAAAGNNGLACQQNGCRVDFGAGASDYASSDGTTVTFAGPVGATSVTTSAASGAAAITTTAGARSYLGGSGGAYLTGSASGLSGSHTITAPTFTATSSAISLASQNLPLRLVSYTADGASAVGLIVRNNAALTTAGAKLATFAPDYANNVVMSIDKDGRLAFASTDASGTPGNATIDKAAGQAAIAASASAVTITNSLVSAASVPMVQLQATDATCTSIKSVVPGAGSFVVNVNAACTADTKIGFVLFN